MIPTEDLSILDVLGVPVDNVRFQSDLLYLDDEDLSRIEDTMWRLKSIVCNATMEILPRQP